MILTRRERTVVFVAPHLRNLPVPPEDINELSIVKRLEAVEKKCDVIESSASHNQIEITTIKDNMSTMTDSIADHDKLIQALAQQIAQLQGQVLTDKDDVIPLDGSPKSQQSVRRAGPHPVVMEIRVQMISPFLVVIGAAIVYHRPLAILMEPVLTQLREELVPSL